MKYFLPLIRKPEVEQRPQLELPVMPEWYITQLKWEQDAQKEDDVDSPPRGVVIIEL